MRECYWDDCALTKQIWTPDAIEPPKLDSFSVGIEISKNLRQLHVGESIKHACAGRGHREAHVWRETDKEKEAAVPKMRTLEAPALKALPSPRLMKPWELLNTPRLPRNVLHTRL